MRRLLYIAICMLLVLSFCSCTLKKNEREDTIEQGGFNPVEISETVKKDDDNSPKNVFTVTSSPFDFEYKTLRLPRSHQKFSVPAEMEVQILTARHLLFTFKGGSEYGLDGLQFHLHLKTPVQTQNALTGYTPDPSVSSYLRSFNNELIYSYFTVGGSRYNIDAVPSVSAAMDRAVSSADAVCCFEFEDSGLINEDTYANLHGYSSLVYAYKFDGIPAVWYAACPSEVIGNVKALLSHIVSTVKYIEPEDRPFSEVTLSGFTVSVPPECVYAKSGASEYYQAPFKGEASSYSAFGVGAFDYESCKAQGFRNIYALFTGIKDDPDANIYSYGHEENVDINGFLADSVDTYYVNVRIPDGDSFFQQGTQVAFRVYRFGEKTLVVFDKDDYFIDHLREFEAKCLGSSFKK